MRLKELAILALIIAMCALVVPASAHPTPATPYMINGWVFYDDGTVCDGPVVSIKNLDTSNNWSVETNASYNYYQLMLANGTDLNVSEILQVNIKKGSQVVIKNHEVTQDEINDGGLFNFNVTLVALTPDQQVWYFTMAENTTVGAPYANDGWVHHKDLVMNKTKPADGTYCELNGQKALWFYANTGAETDLSFGENNWTAKIYTSDPGVKAGNITTVDVCKITQGETVTVLASGSEVLQDDKTEYDINCADNTSTTQDFSTGDWLGVRVSWNGPTDAKIRIYYDPTNGDRDSYIKSPSTDPGYPIPELPTLILFSAGLIILAGYVVLKRRE